MRWIFLSHDDVDHSGNLDEVMTACPNAQLVCNWAMVERHTNCFDFPLDRCRWVMDGESLDIGDRTLQLFRPPVYDSPTTRGLFDPKTRVYWARRHVRDAAPRLQRRHRRPRRGVLARRNDAVRARCGEPVAVAGRPRKVRRVRRPRAESRHQDHRGLPHPGPRGRHTSSEAFAHPRTLPTLDPPPMPDQSVLEQIVAAMQGVQ